MAIDLYTWTTPNGYKPLILLEELGLEYTTHWVNIGEDEQFSPEFIAINPNSKIPALVDHTEDGQTVTVFESAAILMYLAETYGQDHPHFLPKAGQARACVIQWSMFQMASIGPMMGQAFHFLHSAPEGNEYALARYTDEVRRLFAVMQSQLSEHAYIAGPHYSIADMLISPWARAYKSLKLDGADFPQVVDWLRSIRDRPAVKRATALKPK